MHLGCTLGLMLGQPILSPKESLGRRHFAQMHNQAVALEAWCLVRPGGRSCRGELAGVEHPLPAREGSQDCRVTMDGLKGCWCVSQEAIWIFSK